MRLLPLCVLLLAGCSSLPTPDAQLRVTEHGEGYAGILEADGCIVSVVGTLPDKLCVEYTGTRCTVRHGECDGR